MDFSVPLNSARLLSLLAEYKETLQDEEKLKSLSEANWEKLIYLEHQGFLQCKTHVVSTGRHHTSSPNVQGLPKAVRGCIQESGKYILWCDWIASHPNLLAGLSGDKQLIKDVEGDCYSVFAGFERKTVKLFMLLFLNGSGDARLAEVCDLSPFEVARLKKAMRKRWTRAFAELDSWKKQAKKNGRVEVAGYKIKVPDSYKAPSFVLQYIEAQNMMSVAEVEIDGARLIMTVHDELVWSVDADCIETVSQTVMGLMSRFGRAEVEFGSAWGVPDEMTCPEYVNSSDALFRSFYELYDEYHVSGAEDLLDGKYIEFIDIPEEGRHQIFIKAPKGSGKTQAFKRAVLPFQLQDKRILSITPIRSLAKEQSVKINLPHYKKDYDSEIDGSAVLVINSVMRVVGDVDILFLDEVTAILACIKHKGHGRNAGTIPDSEVEQVLMRLKQLIQNARVVVCTDADLNGGALDFVRSARSFDPSEEMLQVFKTERLDNRVLYQNDKVLKEKILRDLGLDKRIWVASTSKGEVKKMHALISAMYPHKTGIVIHSDSEDKEDLIASLDETILETRPDYVLVSPTVQAGVSVDLDCYFDYVAGFYRSGLMISSIFDQMLGRVRKPMSKTAHVWVDKRDMKSCTDAAIILEHLYNRDKICAMSIGFVARHGSPEKVIYTPQGYRLRQSKESELYNAFYAAQIAQENARGSSCALDGYVSYLRANEVKYMWHGDKDPSKEILEAYKEASEAVKQKDIQDVRDAEEITIVKAQSLVEEETSFEERKQIARAFVLDTYGVVNDETIKLYDGGKGRKQLKNLALCIDLIKGGDWCIKSDLVQRSKGLSAATFQNQTPLILVVSDILQEFGVLSCFGSPIYQPIRSDVPPERIKHFVSLLDELGFSIDAKTAVKSPARMVSSICKRVGLRLDVKKVRVEGKILRQYTLSKSHTEFLLSTPYWDKLQEMHAEYEQERSEVVALSAVSPQFRYSKINFDNNGDVRSVVVIGSDVVIPFEMLSDIEQDYLRKRYQKATPEEVSAELKL